MHVMHYPISAPSTCISVHCLQAHAMRMSGLAVQLQLQSRCFALSRRWDAHPPLMRRAVHNAGSVRPAEKLVASACASLNAAELTAVSCMDPVVHVHLAQQHLQHAAGAGI